MADVTQIDGASGTGGIDPSGSAKKGEGNGPSFNEILNAATEDGKTKPAPAENVAGIPPPYIGSLATPREAVLKLSERFLILADTLHTHLEDPRATLKDIDPLIREIESHREKIVEEVTRLPEDDQGRAILEEMAVLASSEAAKFHRSEYL